MIIVNSPLEILFLTIKMRFQNIIATGKRMMREKKEKYLFMQIKV